MNALRVAIIGTGMIAEVHARAVRMVGGRLVGVLGSRPERGAQAAQRWGGRGYLDLEELLADTPDVVHVCTPNATHAPYVRALLAAGVAVVCEKPLGLDGAEAHELADLARRAGVVATVPFVYRYHPLVREIRSRVARGGLGRVLLMHGTYLQDWMLDARTANWRVDPALGGGSRAFADIGSHWCDLVEFVSGERFEAASAQFSLAHPERPIGSDHAFGGGVATAERPSAPVETEDAAIVALRTRSGVPASVVVSQVSAGRKNRLWFEIDGTSASAVFDQEAPETVWFGTTNGASVLRRAEAEPSPEQARLNAFPAGHAQGWGDAFAAFVADTYAAVRGEAPDGLPTFDDGARAADIVDAVRASALSASWEAVAAS
ncbi:Gfo/Idh/MocA family protein [Microbacterium binotii]|uniref:Gfo/Idh/MocA family protein n=1 Tax=Microbacterium binotii TaxID=462710 RepID=UPI001F204664|nr:Gfo/Idh/MocA family oxidoreductase [Microbacterium binotii]UIN29702.1 Gfo/Idh/MocA family oxidoreductase [Microbacterium binotii]